MRNPKESLFMFRLFVGSFILLLEGLMKHITLKWQTNQKIKLKNIENDYYRYNVNRFFVILLRNIPVEQKTNSLTNNMYWRNINVCLTLITSVSIKGHDIEKKHFFKISKRTGLSKKSTTAAVKKLQTRAHSFFADNKWAQNFD